MNGEFEDFYTFEGGKGVFDIVSAAIFAIKSNAATAAGTANLGGDRAVRKCDVDDTVHMRRGHIW